MSLIPGAPKPSRYTRKLNGDEDKILGYDDGEWLEPRQVYEGQAQHYMTGFAEIDEMTEAELYEANEQSGIGH